MNVNNSHQLWKHDISLYETLYGCERYQIRSCCFSMFANVFADFGWVVLSRCPFGLFCCSLNAVGLRLSGAQNLTPDPPCPWMGLLYILTSCKLEPCPPQRVHRMILIIHDHRKSMETICDMYIHLFINVLRLYLYVYVLCLTQVSKAGKSTAEAQPGVIQQRTQRVCAGAGAL